MSKGKVPTEFLQKIKDAVNLIEVVGEHVVLRKGGANHVGLCPFHSERTPSFSVSEQKQLYHCYGCKRGGDLFAFVMELQGISFPEAVEELADRARIALPKDWVGDAGDEDPEVARRRAAAREKISLFYRVNRFASVFYHHALSQMPHVTQYFRQRGVGADLGRAFYIGAAHPSWDALATHFNEKKAPMALAADLGLIRPSQKGARPGGPGYFDLFRNRAMFPILDMRGKVAGFGGRALPTPQGAPDVGSESPKYLNSPESPVFQKGKLAFGLFQAQKHVREQAEVILVEGYFDVLALHAAGFQNVVATCGTALTPDHLSVFKRLGARVIVLFDGDKAGISATERAMEIGLQHGDVIYGAAMPEGLDPDEILFDQATGQPLPTGQEQMKAILTAAKPLLDDRIALAVQEAKQGPEARTQSIKRIAGWLQSFADPVGREVRVEALQTELGVSRQLFEKANLDQRLGERGPGGHVSSQPQRQSQTPRPKPVQVQPRSKAPLRLQPREKLVLAALGSGKRFIALIEEAGRKLPPQMALVDLFEATSAREWVSSLGGSLGELEKFLGNLAQAPGEGLDVQVRSILTEAAVSAGVSLVEDEVKAALNRCVARAWARFSQQIKNELSDAEAKKDAELQSKLMKDYLDVQRKMKEFSSFYDEA